MKIYGIVRAEVVAIALVPIACSQNQTLSSVRDPQSTAPLAAELALDDGQIAEIADAVDLQETQTARLAASRASDPEVRTFAEELSPPTSKSNKQSGTCSIRGAPTSSRAP